MELPNSDRGSHGALVMFLLDEPMRSDPPRLWKRTRPRLERGTDDRHGCHAHGAHRSMEKTGPRVSPASLRVSVVSFVGEEFIGSPRY